MKIDWQENHVLRTWSNYIGVSVLSTDCSAKVQALGPLIRFLCHKIIKSFTVQIIKIQPEVVRSQVKV